MHYCDAVQPIYVRSSIHTVHTLSTIITELIFIFTVLVFCLTFLALALQSPFVDSLIDFARNCIIVSLIAGIIHYGLWSLFALFKGWKFTKHPFQIEGSI